MSRGLFELRQYVLRAADMGAFVKLTSEKIALRTAHSPLVGYWNVEFGQLNSVVHLWQYDSLAHRAKVRAALGSDAVWNGEYMNVVKPMWQSQSNTLLRLSSDSPEALAAAPTGAYALWFAKRSFGKAVPPLMTFEVLAGQHDVFSCVQLVRLPSLDQHYTAIADSDTARREVTQRMLLMTPLPFSPLQ